jgi:hypothetical protein
MPRSIASASCLALNGPTRKKLQMTFGKVTDFVINGDSATAKADGDPIEFERLDGRWYLKPPFK